MEIITVKVTQKHIDAGTQKSCSSCAIALALLAVFNDKQAWTQVYNSQNILIAGYEYTAVSQHINKVQDFINDFDLGNPVKPIKFYLIKQKLHKKLSLKK